MTNLASVLKSEISRLAKRENKDEIKRLKSTASSQRSEIAALKKRLLALEQQTRKLSRSLDKTAKHSTDASSPRFRFSATGLATHRERVGLSADDYDLLVHASGQSVYKWESGKVRPRAMQLTALAKVRSMGKRKALAELQAMTDV